MFVLPANQMGSVSMQGTKYRRAFSRSAISTSINLPCSSFQYERRLPSSITATPQPETALKQVREGLLPNWPRACLPGIFPSDQGLRRTTGLVG